MTALQVTKQNNRVPSQWILVSGSSWYIKCVHIDVQRSQRWFTMFWITGFDIKLNAFSVLVYDKPSAWQYHDHQTILALVVRSAMH